MKSLISNKDRTVDIVSHSLNLLKDVCSSILWFHEGKIKMIGEPEEVIEKYREFMQ